MVKTIDTVSIDQGSEASRVYTLAEGESAVFRVSAEGFQSGPMNLSYECTEVLGEQFENPPESPIVTQAAASSDLAADGAQLPATGADPAFSLALALDLILLGGFVLALSNRKVRLN